MNNISATSQSSLYAGLEGYRNASDSITNASRELASRNGGNNAEQNGQNIRSPITTKPSGSVCYTNGIGNFLLVWGVTRKPGIAHTVRPLLFERVQQRFRRPCCLIYHKSM